MGAGGSADVFGGSKFLWINEIRQRRNQFVRFVRDFSLAEMPLEFPFHLFADTRYRLRVNGEFVAAGPGRFVTQYPEFDSFDLVSQLKVGENRIEVEVNFYGASSFQSMPDGEPGFIAAGGGSGVDLGTPGAWVAYRLDAWRWDAPLYSFAQNPVEICDTRLLGAGVEVPVRVLGKEESPWGALRPYSGAPVPFREHRPDKIEMAGMLANEDFRIGVMAHDAEYVQRLSGVPRLWQGFAVWIHSKKEQTLPMSCFWGEFFCNGKPLKPQEALPRGNHRIAHLELTEGWNLVNGQIEVFAEFWAFCLGFPRSAELSFHGMKDLACTQPMAVSRMAEKEQVDLSESGKTGKLEEGWTLVDGDVFGLTPACMVAWDLASAKSVRNLELDQLGEHSAFRIGAGEGCSWSFSFRGEFLGHIVLDVEAPAGTILDVASDDWKREDGGVAIYKSNPLVDAADRFVLSGGRQTVELFHPRGGKLIQVTMRARGQEADVVLHGIHVRSRQTFRADESRFSSDFPVLDWAWPVAMRTITTSADESYADCPWRERGAYIGDCLVNLHLNFLLTSDLRTALRSMKIFGQAQREDGHLANCAPAWNRASLYDFTLIWTIMLRDYWAGTGDSRVMEEFWPNVQKIWDSPVWKSGVDGLWEGPGKPLFVDWGVLLSEREGEANAILNLFRFGAAKACEEMAKVLGKTADAERFAKEKKSVETSVRKHLWDEAEGRLLPSLGAATPAFHANVLALAFGWSTDEDRARILAYLEPKLRENLKKGLAKGMFGGHIELYFLFYALLALPEHGRVDLAEEVIGEIYGYLKDLGDDTFPESFCQVAQETGSRCHSWSGVPAIYAARNVLGLRQKEAGNPDRLIFSPRVAGITRASGKVAHRFGWVEIEWEKVGGELRLTKASLPEGVELFRETGEKISV